MLSVLQLVNSLILDLLILEVEKESYFDVI